MSFQVSAEAYDRFMGRYSEPLAAQLVARAQVSPGQHALDVGCGPGALTAELVRILEPGAVSAIDPSPPFVTAVRERFPGVDVRPGVAESLPFPDGAFDVTLAQLVVHFMPDAVAGLREMARVTRNGGVVAACVWDHAGGGGPLATFWQAVRGIDPEAPDEGDLPGTREGHLAELFTAAGLRDVEPSTLTVTMPFDSFDRWWEPYTLGVGPAGAYVSRLDEPNRAILRDRCAELLPAEGPFDVTASAWCVRSVV